MDHWVPGVLLEKHLINVDSNQNSSNASGLSLSRDEICKCLCDYVLTWNELQLSIALGREYYSFGTFMNVLMFFVTFIRISGRGRGDRRCRPRRQEMPIPDEIPAQQEGVGQANVAEPVGQQPWVP